MLVQGWGLHRDRLDGRGGWAEPFLAPELEAEAAAVGAEAEAAAEAEATGAGGRFPAHPDDMSGLLGSEPKVGATRDETPRMTWEPNADTRIRYESHPGDAGFNPRHHGPHYHVETKPPGMSWNQAKRGGKVTKSKPPGYTPGSGTGFLPGERFP